MPPPTSLPIKQEYQGTDEKSTANASILNGDVERKKLETPLAAMLPSKYANIDVTELFPDFRHGKVLRFSRLFGPGKPSSLPNIWKNVRKKRRKKKHKDSTGQHDSDSMSDDDRPKNRGWYFDYAPLPQANECASDDEVIFIDKHRILLR